MIFNSLFIFLLLLTPQLGCAQQARNSAWEQSPYFDTNFLLQYDKVQKQLFADGFEKVYFPTSDGFRLCGLFRQVPNARASVIFCNGWFPGRKESLTTLFHVLRDQNINMLFFDARNHGESDGSSFQNVFQYVMPTSWFRHFRPIMSNWFMYGSSEFKDIVSAIKYVKHRSDVPLIIFGTCAGAFHAAHALIDLSQQNTQLGIKGFIFDSGWASLYSASKSAIIDSFNRGIQSLYSFAGRDKKEIKQSLLYRISSSILNTRLTLLHNILVAIPFRHRDGQMHLSDKIQHITIPTFFIHSLDDTAVPATDVVPLAQQCPNAFCWWIPQSTHACHYLKHKYEYRRRLLKFIDHALEAPSTLRTRSS